MVRRRAAGEIVMSNGAAYLVAVLVGTLYSVRKLEVQRVRGEDNPGVPPSEFAAWQQRETRAYALVASACVLMIALDVLWRFYISRATVAPAAIRGVGATIFFAWVFAIILGIVRGRAARKQRGRLGIVLGRAPVPR
jgi:hypothetical protein